MTLKRVGRVAVRVQAKRSCAPFTALAFWANRPAVLRLVQPQVFNSFNDLTHIDEKAKAASIHVGHPTPAETARLLSPAASAPTDPMSSTWVGSSAA